MNAVTKALAKTTGKTGAAPTRGRLEHANITVSDIDRSSKLLQDLLGWEERWRGPAINGGETIHVGEEFSYIAVYTDHKAHDRFAKGAPMNHLGLVVGDLEAAAATVIEAGLVPFNYGDYEPGRRFYFFDWDGIEFEMVCYE